MESEIKNIILEYLSSSSSGAKKAIMLSKYTQIFANDFILEQTKSVTKFYINHLIKNAHKDIDSMIDHDEHVNFMCYFNKWVYFYTNSTFDDMCDFADVHIMNIITNMLVNQKFSHKRKYLRSLALYFRPEYEYEYEDRDFDLELSVEAGFNISIVHNEIQTDYIFSKKETKYTFANIDPKISRELNKYPNLDEILCKIFRILLIWEEMQRILNCFTSFCNEYNGH